MDPIITITDVKNELEAAPNGSPTRLADLSALTKQDREDLKRYLLEERKLGS